MNDRQINKNHGHNKANGNEERSCLTDHLGTIKVEELVENIRGRIQHTLEQKAENMNHRKTNINHQ